MNNKRGLSFGEKLLLLFACCLTLLCAYLYVNNKQLQSFLLPESDETLTAVGSLKVKTGKIQRETLNDSVFNEIAQNAILYNNDLILTSKESSAVLKLNDDGELNLSPNTMIRLNQESVKDNTGLYKTYKIEVLTGEVFAKSNAKDEKTKVFLKSKSEHVTVSKGQNNSLRFKQEDFNTKLDTKFDQTLPEKVTFQPMPSPSPTPSPTPLPTPLPSPTKVEHPSPTPTPVDLIKKTKPHKIETKLKELPIRPKPALAAQRKESPKNVLEVLPIVHTPKATSPIKASNLSIIRNLSDKNGKKELFLTWSRDNVQDYYEIQIATDQDFKHIIVKTKSEMNFYYFSQFSVGLYWWRVKSITQTGLSSPYSDAMWFKLIP